MHDHLMTHTVQVLGVNVSICNSLRVHLVLSVKSTLRILLYMIVQGADVIRPLYVAGLHGPNLLTRDEGDHNNNLCL